MKKKFLILMVSLLFSSGLFAQGSCTNPNGGTHCELCTDANTAAGSYAACCIASNDRSKGCPYSGTFGPINKGLIFLILIGTGFGAFAIHRRSKMAQAS